MTALVQAYDASLMRVRRMGIDTYQECIIYMRKDCPICASEGWSSQVRIQVAIRDRTIVATLNVVGPGLLEPDEAGLSDAAWLALAAQEGDAVRLSPSPPLDSFRHVRGKVYGRRLGIDALGAIVSDVSTGRYSPIHLAAFVTACASGGLDPEETVALTRAMVAAGDRIRWPHGPVLDKHCVGGLPGNRTSMLVVPIVAACGAIMPKTSSRAITSPAGTADAMETVAPVSLDLLMMRKVVEREGGCIVWGGSVQLSPADDLLIRVERPLDLDSEGQLVASVLSKKVAAGATHVLIDLPVGPTAKVRSVEAARTLSQRLIEVGRAMGLAVHVVESDGSQPVGRGIGPALEARDVLAVLRRESHAPVDLRDRALSLAARLLEMGGAVPEGNGIEIVRSVLASGDAWRKFLAICQAQGGFREPTTARFRFPVPAPHSGFVIEIDNRRLARIAKLAGAPVSPAAGVDFHTPIGTRVEAGEPMFTLHAESPGQLAYARAYVEAGPPVVLLGAPHAAADPAATWQ